jgi:cytochrome P450
MLPSRLAQRGGATMTGADEPLPPGSMGAPIVGETLAFGRNPFAFLDDRHGRHGGVFKSRLFGRNIVFLTGTAGAEAFYDGDNITRENAHPFPLVQLFGGINMEMYDGPKHLALKSIALEAFDRAAIERYLPGMQPLIEAALAGLAGADEFSAVAELRKLVIEVICSKVLGMALGAETQAMTRDYAIVIPGLVAIPIAVPFTAYGRAITARDRILGRIRAAIAERRKRPGADGLSRMLAGKFADGRTFTDEEALLEVHHIVMAGFVVYALMAEAMRQLGDRGELRARCAAEVSQHAPAGPLSMAALSKLETTTHVVLETKRFLPLVPLAFGRAKRDFVCGGFRVPAGWTVYLTLPRINHDPTIYSVPDKFDPDRFRRGEHRKHRMAFIPQGAEPATGHRCLGLDYATALAVAYLVLLIRGYDWELPPQNFALNWQRLPPEPRDGLRVRLRARS